MSEDGCVVVGSRYPLAVGASIQIGDRVGDGQFTDVTIGNRRYVQPIRVVRETTRDAWIAAGNSWFMGQRQGLRHFYEIESD